MNNVEEALDQEQQCNIAWKINYLEAAIYIEEGENNDKFDSHPRTQDLLPAYLITHNTWFYLLDLFASTILILLALIERPSIEIFRDVTTEIHASIELFALAVLGISIVLQIRWHGLSTFFSHKRSLIKTCLWVIMLIEALVVLARATSHIRITRSLRPFFIADNRFFGGVRRLLRQILQSVPPICEVFALLFFTLVIFTVFGFYLFNSDVRDPYFDSFHTAFIQLYILLTTANFPDVMMPSYAKNRWSALYFISFLVIVLYFIMNLMLAIVFVEFSAIEKEKFRKLLLHKREACTHAFKLLISRSKPNSIDFNRFVGLMSYVKPNFKRRDVYLLYKTLNTSRSGEISLKEFYNIYDALELRWGVDTKNRPWFFDLWKPVQYVGLRVIRLVESNVFKVFFYGVIASSLFILVVRTVVISSFETVALSTLKISNLQVVCLIIYIIEITLKLFAYGTEKFFCRGWNRFDFVVISLGVVANLAQYHDIAFFFILILRPLRLLTLLSVLKRYQDIAETLLILRPRIISTGIVISIIFYFFAICGIEFFSHYDLKNCCVNTSVEDYYRVDNSTFYESFYYLNNFSNIVASFVTLFELNVVNNWFITMQAYAHVAGAWSRLYFISFSLTMMVVMAIVVAFIIEAFTFRKGYSDSFQAYENDDLTVKTSLNNRELDFIYRGERNVNILQEYAATMLNSTLNEISFIGKRLSTKSVLQRRMYADLISCWLEDHDCNFHNRIPPDCFDSYLNSDSEVRNCESGISDSERNDPDTVSRNFLEQSIGAESIFESRSSNSRNLSTSRNSNPQNDQKYSNFWNKFCKSKSRNVTSEIDSRNIPKNNSTSTKAKQVETNSRFSHSIPSTSRGTSDNSGAQNGPSSEPSNKSSEPFNKDSEPLVLVRTESADHDQPFYPSALSNCNT